MKSVTRTAAFDGSESVLVTVECSTTSGFAGMQVVGNTSDLCRDGKERAKTALEKLGLRLGHKRIVLNLSPASCRKEGSHFDLPIAVSLALLAREEGLAHDPAAWLFAAELSLDGELRPIRAVIPLVLTAMQHGLKGLILASEHRPEIATLHALLGGQSPLQVLTFSHLSEVLSWLFEGLAPALQSPTSAEDLPQDPSPTFDDMQLSPELQDLAVVCAAGQHSLLLRGAPGTGKSMFAQRLLSLRPRLQPSRHIEVLQVYSLQHERLPHALMEGRPPFRHPHHAASPQAILGTAKEPGDLALAHGGILFLDELPEFRRDLLEALREPLEYGRVCVSRAQHKTEWRAAVQFIAACNNCPCGWSGSRRRLCRCSSSRVQQYASRLSGPLLDRIDIHFNMPETHALSQTSVPSKPESQTQMLRERVARTLAFSQRQQREFAGSLAHLRSVLACSDHVWSRILEQLETLRLSSRALGRCLAVARTLADMEQCEAVDLAHVLRAAHWQHAPAARARGDSMEL